MCRSPLPYRFYKLHERKCEPIIMTVPRKVSGWERGWAGLRGGKERSRPGTLLVLVSPYTCSQTCSKTTFTQIRRAPNRP